MKIGTFRMGKKQESFAFEGTSILDAVIAGILMGRIPFPTISIIIMKFEGKNSHLKYSLEDDMPEEVIVIILKLWRLS